MLNSMLREIYTRTKEDALRSFTVRLLARESALSHNYTEMIFYNTELIKDYHNSVNELTALYDLATYYAEIEQKLAKVSEFFFRMKETYPVENLTLFAGINLGNNFESFEKK